MKPATDVTETCFDCGKELPKPSPEAITTGYGLDADDHKICYACCAIRDQADMDETGRATLYLSVRQDRSTLEVRCYDYKVTNWPNSLSYSATVRKGKHNVAGTRHDAWFVDHKGRRWHGVQYGENTQLCRCQRLKENSHENTIHP